MIVYKYPVVNGRTALALLTMLQLGKSDCDIEVLLIRFTMSSKNNANKIKTVSYPRHPHLVKGQGHTKVKNVHNMLSHGDTRICQHFVCLCQRAKTSFFYLTFPLIDIYIHLT